MEKPYRSKNHKRIPTSVAASILCLLLCTVILAANFTAPAYAWYRSNTSNSASTIQSATYSVTLDYNNINVPFPKNGQGVVEPVVVTLENVSYNSQYTFRLSAAGAASTGYCAVSYPDANSETVTKYLTLAPGATVNLTITASQGTKVTFTYSWGSPADQTEQNTIQVTDGMATFARLRRAAVRTAPVMNAYLEISHTPFARYTMPEDVSLVVVAGHYGVSPEDILIFNGYESEDEITAGTELLIPNPSTEEPYEPPQVYTVQEGDTLQSIAESCGVTIKSLCQWNNIEMDTILYAGMELTIPVLYKPAEESEPAETQPTETEPTESEPVETQPAETESAQTQPVETQPTETEPTETEPVETQPTETESSETVPEETVSEETETPEAEDDTVYVGGVPVYFQSDYPDTLYADGTVKTSGCSVTCLTMVANAVTGYDYTVDELAEYFGGRAINNMERLEIGSETLGLTFHKSENWDYTWAALQEGKIVIALMDGLEGECLFTDSQHFIVLAGLNEDGKILVNDPNAGNYEIWNLKNGFENGFDANAILLGYSGAWIYDRTLEELPARYSEPRLVKSEENKNYPQIDLTNEERELLARVIWVEAQGECAEGQQAVAEVVFNRMLSDQFGDTLNDVIYGEGQFRSVPYLEDAKPTQAQYQAIDRALYGENVLPKNVYYFATYATNANIYQQIGNHIFCY